MVELYPGFTRVTDCLCHVPVPDAWSRYDRKRWWCGYAVTLSAAAAATPEPEIIWSTMRAVSRAFGVTADALYQPESITGYKMAACTVGRTTASYSLNWDRCVAKCGVQWQPGRRQFVEQAWEDVHGKFEQRPNRPKILYPRCVKPWPRPKQNLVSLQWWVHYWYTCRSITEWCRPHRLARYAAFSAISRAKAKVHSWPVARPGLLSGGFWVE